MRKISLAIFAIFAIFAVKSFAALEIANGSATNITATNAWLVGNLVSTNATNATLTCYYGAGNGGTNIDLWQYSNAYGVAASTGLVSVLATNLTPATWYYFNWKATETTNTAWASGSSSNCTTLATAPTNYPITSTNPSTVMAFSNGAFASPTRDKIVAANGLLTTGDVANITILSQRVNAAEGNISSNTTAINNVSNRVTGIESNYLVKATNAPISGYALFAEVAGGTTNFYWGPAETNSVGVTNQIMDAAGFVWTITNAPPAAGKYTLEFNPANSTAWFAAETITNWPTPAEIGAVPTNDLSVTNARPWDSPNYNTLTNPPTLGATNVTPGAGYSWNPSTRTITVNSNDFGGGGGVGTTNAGGINVAFVPTNYTPATPDVEAHLVGIDGKIETNRIAITDGTNIVWTVDAGGTNHANCTYTYDDTAVKANNVATSNAIPTTASQVGAYPNASGLNVSNRVTILETNTPPLQSYLSTSNNVKILLTNTATAVQGATADAALSKTFTNSAVFKEIQITGGTINNSIVCTTNSGGQLGCLSLPYIQLDKTTAQTFPANDVAEITWTSAVSSNGGMCNGTRWIPGNGTVVISVMFAFDAMSHTGDYEMDLMKNGGSFLPGVYDYIPGRSYFDGVCTWTFRNTVATNAFSIRLYTVFGNACTNGAARGSWFFGAVISP